MRLSILSRRSFKGLSKFLKWWRTVELTPLIRPLSTRPMVKVALLTPIFRGLTVLTLETIKANLSTFLGLQLDLLAHGHNSTKHRFYDLSK